MRAELSETVTAIPPYGIFEIARLARERRDAIHLNLGEPDFVTPAPIREAARRAIDEGFTHYTHDAGIPELREALAGKLAAFNGMAVDPERELRVTAGSQEALYLALATVLRPGDEVIVLEPYYPHYVINVLLHRARPVFVTLDARAGYHLDAAALRARLSRRTKAVILNSPMNPLGAVIPEATVRAVAEAIAGTPVLLVSDEAYERILYDGRRHFSPGAIPEIRDQVISIFTFSKTYAMTGWRVGYMTAAPDILEAAGKLHLAITGYVNSIAQKAALAALACEDDVRAMVDEYAARRRIVAEGLRDVDFLAGDPPEGAFYYFLEVQDGSTALEAAKRCIREAGVVLVPGHVFGPSGEGRLRLSFAAPRARLAEALARLAAMAGRPAVLATV